MINDPNHSQNKLWVKSKTDTKEKAKNNLKKLE